MQRVVLDLAVVAVEALAEVAAAVEEADPDERDAELRRRLEMVAGEHAEAAGVDRQALVQARTPRRSTRRGSRPGRSCCVHHVSAPRSRIRRSCTRSRRSRYVGRQRALELGVGQLGEERGRVVVELGEPSRLEIHEEPPRLRDPREREIARDRGTAPRATSRRRVPPPRAGSLTSTAVPSCLWNGSNPSCANGSPCSTAPGACSSSSRCAGRRRTAASASATTRATSPATPTSST